MNMSTTDTLTSSVGVQDQMAQGMAAAQAGDKAGAHKIFQAVAAHSAHMPEVWVWLGGTSSSLDEAEAAFQRAVMLDPANEEANLGLRWVALRRQVTAHTGGADLSTGSFDQAMSSTKSLTSSTLNSNNLGSGALSTGSLKSEDADKGMKVKVGRTGRRLNVPIAAIFLFALSLVLYGIVAYFLIFANH
jgi:hypothetical protein